MKNTVSITGTLEVVKRLPSSLNGNPRYLLRIAGYGEFRTAPDSSYGYTIKTYQGKQVRAIVGIHYGVETLAMVVLT